MNLCDFSDFPFKEFEMMAENCVSVRQDVMPVVEQLREVVSKGASRNLNDLRFQMYLEAEIARRIDKITTERAASVVSCMDSQRGGVDMSANVEFTEVSDLISNVYSDGKSFATCDAKMFVTSVSAGKFVHGPDALMPVVQLLNKLVADGERLESVQRFSWKKPMKNNLKLAVYDRDFNGGDNGDYVMEGKFTTSEGRMLTVLGMDNPDSPVKIVGVKNPYAEGTICNCPECCRIDDSRNHSFELINPSVPECFELFANDNSIAVATLVEVLTKALTKMDISENKAPVVLRMLGGIRNLQLPKDMSDVFGEGRRLDIRIIEDKRKKGHSGMIITPFEFKFPHQESVGTGIYAVTDNEVLATARCR